jgi:hypothetical protein
VIKVNHCIPIISRCDKEDDEELLDGEVDDPTGMKKASNGRPNALVTHMTRLILNHAPLGSY